MDQVLSAVKALEDLVGLLQNVNVVQLEADASALGAAASALEVAAQAAGTAAAKLLSDLKAQLPSPPAAS